MDFSSRRGDRSGHLELPALAREKRLVLNPGGELTFARAVRLVVAINVRKSLDQPRKSATIEMRTTQLTAQSKRLACQTTPWLPPMAHKQGPDGSRILTALEVDAAAIGFRKVHDVALNTTRWVVNCQGCGNESAHGWPSNTGPAIMVRNMKRIGWALSSKFQKCPV